MGKTMVMPPPEPKPPKFVACPVLPTVVPTPTLSGSTPTKTKIRGTGAATKGLYSRGPMG